MVPTPSWVLRGRGKNICLVVRVTQGIDATKQSTLEYILDIVRTSVAPVLLFAAMPCTGGSPWQRLNRLKPGGPRMMMKHRKLFNDLWSNFDIICGEIQRHGHQVAIEWPRFCSYWKATKVIALLNRYGFVHAEFDGCMFNLYSRVHEGVLIKKPWRISTTSRAIHAVFNDRKCSGGHKHTPCQGQDTKFTENYTEEMVKTLHVAWQKHARTLTRRTSGTGQFSTAPTGTQGSEAGTLAVVAESTYSSG